MSRHADGKTHLETECLSVSPMSLVQVKAVLNAAKGDSIIVALCLSHERLRAELDGALQVIEDALQVIEEMKQDELFREGQ
jgi:hypothetical protein